jgi:carboxyl-terminal processing protease
MIFRKILLLFSLAFFSLPATAELQCRFLGAIEQYFLSQHLRFSQLDKSLQDRVIEQYVKSLDPTKMYLLKSDVESIKKDMGDLFGKINAKDCAPLEQAQKILLSRVQERASFAREILGKNYKFDKTVEINFDVDNRPYPSSVEEAQSFTRKYVHFQISNYLLTDVKVDEAVKNVEKNWERVVKRTKETKTDQLYSNYLDSFARALDPHSSYFSKDALEDFEISMNLSLEGIGATLSSQDGFTIVEALVPGGSAAKSGLMQPQDKIIAVAQGEKGVMESVMEMDLRDVVRKIRGEKGSKVRLSILRKEKEGVKKLEVTLVRDKITLEDEAASIVYLDRDVNGSKRKIAILNLPSFYANSKRGERSSASDVKKLLTEARNKKVDGLILDLSNNGGGSLEDAVKIAGLFFQVGNVVKQSGRDERRDVNTLRDMDPIVDWPGPLVVLTSRVSASASEIVAGTLKDYKRAVVVGNDHTFGKGSVQSVMPIPQDLGAIKVTVGMFYTPGGDSTQHRGVESDVVIPGPFTQDDVGEKSLDYSLPPKKIENFISAEASVKEGPQAWRPVNKDWLKVLSDKSKIRVEKSEDFKKIVEENKQLLAKNKILKLSEAGKDKEKKEKAKAIMRASKEEKNKEYLKRADVGESINVMMDLISLLGGQTLTKN